MTFEIIYVTFNNVLDAKVNFQDAQRCSPLTLACRKNHAQVAQYLITRGAKLYKSILHDFYDNREIGTMLLRNGASVNYIGENGSTILHKACRAGNIELVEGILSQVAYSKLILPRRLIKLFRGRGKHLKFFGHCRIGVNSTDEHRRTPLHLGCEAGHHRIVQLLINHKAQVIQERGDCG